MFYTLVSAVIGEGEGRLDQLEGDDLTSLEQLVATGSGPAVHRARTLLSLNGSPTGYVEPVYLTGGLVQKSNRREVNRPQQATSYFDLWPNPAEDFIILKWDWFKAGLDGSFEVEVSTVEGKLVQALTIDDPKLNTKLIRLSDLPSGVYFINLRQKEKLLDNFKVVIE